MFREAQIAGQTLEAADVVEFSAQSLYRQGDSYVFMDTGSYEQYELTAEQVGDAVSRAYETGGTWLIEVPFAPEGTVNVVPWMP